MRDEFLGIGGASGDEAEGLTEETGIPLDVWLAGLLLIGAVFFVGSARLQARGVGGNGLAAARTVGAVLAVVGIAVSFYARLPRGESLQSGADGQADDC